MLKPIVLAAFLSCAAAGADAQTAPTQPTPPSPGAPVREVAPVERTMSTGDFNASGDLGASALLGTKVRNANKESIGKINEIYVDKDSKITVVIISVGGFLGAGPKHVAGKWTAITCRT